MGVKEKNQTHKTTARVTHARGSHACGSPNGKACTDACFTRAHERSCKYRWAHTPHVAAPPPTSAYAVFLVRQDQRVSVSLYPPPPTPTEPRRHADCSLLARINALLLSQRRERAEAAEGGPAEPSRAEPAAEREAREPWRGGGGGSACACVCVCACAPTPPVVREREEGGESRHTAP